MNEISIDGLKARSEKRSLDMGALAKNLLAIEYFLTFQTRKTRSVETRNNIKVTETGIDFSV